MPIRACVLDDPHPEHERVNGKWCPGIEADESDGPDTSELED